MISKNFKFKEVKQKSRDVLKLYSKKNMYLQVTIDFNSILLSVYFSEEVSSVVKKLLVDCFYYFILHAN